MEPTRLDRRSAAKPVRGQVRELRQHFRRAFGAVAFSGFRIRLFFPARIKYIHAFRGIVSRETILSLSLAKQKSSGVIVKVIPNDFYFSVRSQSNPSQIHHS